MPAISVPGNLTSRTDRARIVLAICHKSRNHTSSVRHRTDSAIVSLLQDDLVLTRKQAAWHDRQKSIFHPSLLFFLSISDVQLATVLSLKERGRQARLGTSVVIATNLHDLAVLFTAHEITNGMLFSFALHKSLRSHFGKWLPYNHYVSVLFSNRLQSGLLRNCPTSLTTELH